MPVKKKVSKKKEKDPLEEIIELLNKYEEGTEPKSSLEHMEV